MLLTSGRIFDANKVAIVPARVLIQNQDTQQMFLANNAADGTGLWSIPSQEASDFTVEVLDPSYKTIAEEFHLSQLPTGFNYDPTKGYVETFSPFVQG